MKKKKYIAPETVVIHVPSNCTLLSRSGEDQVDTGDGSGPHGIDEGGLDDGEEISAKQHNSLWDEDESFNSWK